MGVRKRSTDRLRRLLLFLTTLYLVHLVTESIFWPIPILTSDSTHPESVLDQAYTALKHVRETKSYIRGTKIPKIIHQTWSSRSPSHQPHHVRTSLYNWKYKNPDFTYLLWTDDDMEAFVKVLFPETYEWYSLLPKIVMKADLFRLLVLKTFGGIYTDADTLCLTQPDRWLDNEIAIWQYGSRQMTPTLPIGLIVGLENDVPLHFGKNWTQYYTNPLQIVQWTMASAVNHPVLSDTIGRIYKRVLGVDFGQLGDEDVTALTGPGPWTDAIHASWAQVGVNWRDLREFGLKSRVIGDQVVLPTVGFAAGTTAVFGDMNSRHPFDRDAKIQHMWKGTWRVDP